MTRFPKHLRPTAAEIAAIPTEGAPAAQVPRQRIKRFPEGASQAVLDRTRPTREERLTAHVLDPAAVAWGADGVVVPRRIAIDWASSRPRPGERPAPPNVRLEVEIVDGRARCQSITALAGELTGELLRTVPVSTLVRAGVWAWARDTREWIAVTAEMAAARRLSADEASALSEPRGRGRKLPAGAVEEAARIYAKALAVGDPPVAAVMKRFSVSRATASRWIARADEQGLIPERMRHRRQK